MSLAVYVCLLGKPFWQESKNNLYAGWQEVGGRVRHHYIYQIYLILSLVSSSSKVLQNPQTIHKSLRCCSSKRGLNPGLISPHNL